MNSICTNQAGSRGMVKWEGGGGVLLLLPAPFHSRLLVRYFKDNITISSYPGFFLFMPAITKPSLFSVYILSFFGIIKVRVQRSSVGRPSVQIPTPPGVLSAN
jgi:hypothetical protein